MRKLRGLVFSGFGETKTATEWAQDSRCLVSARTLYQRLSNGEQLVGALLRPAFRFAISRERTGQQWEAFGEAKTVYQWEKDPRRLVIQKTLRYRMLNGESLEEALSRPAENAKTRAFWKLDGR